MANWRDEYSAALAVRDRREKANVPLYNAYTQLADRTAKVAPTPAESKQHIPPTAASKGHPSGPGSPELSLQEALVATRADLTEAQRSRAELQDKLARVNSELEKYRKRSAQDSRRMNALDGERTQLQLRLKDRDEELRGKAKLLD
ncbi:autophagy protein 16, interacts with Atg12p-Atg5p, partial [Elasticomyces elasticus]